MSEKRLVKIIGGGLAGCECALQLLERGYAVKMYEMRPLRTTGAHKTENLAELVCSNSLKSSEPCTASGLLKEELDLLGCRLLPLARENAVPSGSALSVEREGFSKSVENALNAYPDFTLVREEVTSLDEDVPTVVASGPLTSDSLAKVVGELTGKDRLFFYDAIAPIVEFDSIDMSKAFFASRYGKGTPDYINCPMTKEEYDAFYNELINAKQAVLHGFEDSEVFEGCMPVEVMARRGRDTLLFGPLKPVGLIDPRTEKRSEAVVQLRKDNAASSLYNIVGFQTHLLFGEQKRVFSMIPGLENAEFVRYGVMHRNTFLRSPGLLTATYEAKKRKGLFFAGQMTGVEGYVESVASGFVAGINADPEREEPFVFPSETALGALANYISTADPKNFQPMNVNFGIFPPLEFTGKKVKKADRKELYSLRSLEIIKKIGEKLL